MRAAKAFARLADALAGLSLCLAYGIRQKKKCLVSVYPTDPNILGPTQTFLKAFGILKSIFRLF